MSRAHCDIATGKIYGCKRGTIEWWHEKGHIVFNSNENTSWLLMLKSYIFTVWMFAVTGAIAYNVLYYIAVVLLAIYIFLEIYEEWWCNQYANSHYYK